MQKERLELIYKSCDVCVCSVLCVSRSCVCVWATVESFCIHVAANISPLAAKRLVDTEKPLRRLEFPNSGQIINPKVEVISLNFPKLRTGTARPAEQNMP